MEPKDRAIKLRSEREYEYGKSVIEHMILHYIGIDLPDLEEYWEQVLEEYEKL